MPKNTTRKGLLAELIALEHVVDIGFDIALPYGNQTCWDFLIYLESVKQWRSCQVKTAYRRDRHRPRNPKPLYVDCTRGSGNKKSNRHYPPGAFDYLIAVDIPTRRCWIYDYRTEVQGHRCIAIDEGVKHA